MGGEVILVCVTGQRSSARLIHRGAELARAHDARLLVLSVSGSGLNLLEEPGVAAALDELYRLSGEVGAEHDHAPRRPTRIAPSATSPGRAA